ncbi:hypothetical protein M2132_001803 [Dysgonomonas sp. PH5-45]|uniref:hypothetical protein n=1 Tax=unclassified Dysgonomonas TaxID=2630389 RepID=UPI002472F470|nr:MULTISPECIES: hypothetical protein [unclassified Dysgonomonas]MDH6355460.1 hypothetical protein [Dysgonomonas sp. PH5-45]MDH6388356.1 hypothetical protein [Dysgonomonas sp. PH5-37]
MADKCINLEDIDHNLGCDGGNVSGIVPEVIFGYHEDVATWPDEPVPTNAGGVTTPLTLEEAGALDGDVAMKPGTRAFKIAFTEDVGSLTITTDGETDGMSVIYTLTIIKAKISKQVLGFINAAINRKLFFIPQDENGVRYLMGNKRRGCTFVSGGDGSTTGTTSSDRNQTTLQFTFRAGKALVYEGVTDELLTEVPTP